MRAVNDGDSKKIFEIGKAIESLYALAQKGAHPDSYRREILEIKKRLDQRGEKWSVRQVAEFIGWPDMSGTDGFKQVRNMCDELKFPLTKLRQKADKAKLPD